MPSTTDRAAMSDGTELLTRHWPSVSPAPWGHVLLVHGLGEQSGRYDHVGEHLARAGLAVDAFDLRGTGGSGGRRGHVERWSRFHDDLGERLAAVRTAAGTDPVILYGHSMGGLIVAGYLLDDRPKPDLAVLGSPGLDSTIASWKKRLAPIVARVAPTLAIPNDIRPETLSRDPSVGSDAAADPRNGTSSTARFGAEGLAAQARVRGDARRGFGVPTLVIHGEDDGLVPVRASAVLSEAPGVERRTYPGLRHELHNEPEGPAILDDVIAWIRDRVGERATLIAQPNTASGERLER